MFNCLTDNICFAIDVKMWVNTEKKQNQNINKLNTLCSNSSSLIVSISMTDQKLIIHNIHYFCREHDKIRQYSILLIFEFGKQFQKNGNKNKNSVQNIDTNVSFQFILI